MPAGEVTRGCAGTFALQFGLFLTLGYCIFMVNESFFQPEAINTAYVSRFSTAMIAHDTAGLLQWVRNASAVNKAEGG